MDIQIKGQPRRARYENSEELQRGGGEGGDTWVRERTVQQ